MVCPKSSCSGLAEEWDVNWWYTPPALFTQQGPHDVQKKPDRAVGAEFFLFHVPDRL